MNTQQMRKQLVYMLMVYVWILVDHSLMDFDTLLNTFQGFYGVKNVTTLPFDKQRVEWGIFFKQQFLSSYIAFETYYFNVM